MHDLVTLLPEPPEAAAAIEALLDLCFGPGRHRKTVARLRDGRVPAAGLSWIAQVGERLIGTVRFWHVRIGSATDALLLGPIAIDPAWHGTGAGSRLIRRTLAIARAQGHAAVILVGDEPYYRRFGFSAALTRRMALPGPVEAERFLGLEIVPGSLGAAAGLVRPTGAIACARAPRAWVA